MKFRRDSAGRNKSLLAIEEELAILEAERKEGSSRPLADLFDDIMAMRRARADLMEEARLALVGGPVMDRLAHRLKRMAEEDGAPMILIP